MESQPQNPEFRNNLENFHPCCHLACRSAPFDLLNACVVNYFSVFNE